MSKWPMRGHFGHLRFKTFPMTPKTPRIEVFWALLSNSKNSGVQEDSKSATLGVWVSSSHLAKVGLRQKKSNTLFLVQQQGNTKLVKIPNLKYKKRVHQNKNWAINEHKNAMAFILNPKCLIKSKHMKILE
jgi:hypothetical protein